MPGCAIDQVHGPLCVRSVYACACVQTRACVPTAGMCLRAPPSSSLLCMHHPSMATEKPSAGGTGGRRCGVERAWRSQPAEVSGTPALQRHPRPLRWCSSMVATVFLITSWCGGTSRRLGRKPPSLHGRRQGPTGPARPSFHPPSSRATPTKLFVEPCPSMGGSKGWVGCSEVVGNVEAKTLLAAPLPLGSRLWA